MTAVLVKYDQAKLTILNHLYELKRTVAEAFPMSCYMGLLVNNLVTKWVNFNKLGTSASIIQNAKKKKNK